MRSRDLPIFVFYSKAYQTKNDKFTCLIYLLTIIAIVLTISRFLNSDIYEEIIRNVKNNFTLLSIKD